MYKLLLAAALAFLLISAQSNCPANSMLANLESSLVTVSVGADGNLVLVPGQNYYCYNYTLTTAFASPPQVTVATNILEAFQSGDLSFSISPLKEKLSNTLVPIVVNANSSNSRWNVIQFNLLAEGRSEIEVGTFLAGTPVGYVDTSLLTDCAQSSKVNVANRLVSAWLPNSIIRVFISGFLLDQNGANSDYTLSLSNGTTDGSNIYVDITKNSPIKIYNVRVGFIVYNPTQVNYVLLVADNVVRDVNGKQTTTLNPENRTLIANQFLFGITGFSVKGALSVSLQIDPLLNVTYGAANAASNIGAMSYSTILFSRPVTAYCEGCPAGSQLQGLACVLCPALSSWQNGSCQCNQGYYNISGTCQQCPAGTSYLIASNQCVSICLNNTSWVNGQCECNTGYYNISGLCQQCADGTVYRDGACVLNCPANATYLNGKCVCNQGLVLKDGSCQTCPPGSYLLGDRCQSICPSNSSWQNGQCYCNEGYNVIDGSCQQCPSGTVYLRGQCQVPCPANSSNSARGCVCNSGYYNISGRCQKCQDNSAWDGRNCNCLTGYFNISSVCQTCQPGTAYSEQSQLCIPLCNDVNSYWNNNNCVCKADYYNISGLCQKCLRGSQWNGAQCVALAPVNSGTTSSTSTVSGGNWSNSSTSGNTGSSSTSGSTTTTTTTIITTTSNQTDNKGTTGTVVGGSTVVTGSTTNTGVTTGSTTGSTAVIGNAGSTNTADSTVTTTNNTFTSIGFIDPQTIVTCPANSVPSPSNGNLCQCNPGYFPNKNRCVFCPSFASGFDGSKCICSDGYILSANGSQCVKCPATFISSKNTCVCPSGKYNISGTCQSCPSNTVFNGTGCSCAIGTFLVNNNCVVCPINSYYNGTHCACNQGYFLNADRNGCNPIVPVNRGSAASSGQSTSTGSTLNNTTSTTTTTTVITSGTGTPPIGIAIGGAGVPPIGIAVGGVATAPIGGSSSVSSGSASSTTTTSSTTTSGSTREGNLILGGTLVSGTNLSGNKANSSTGSVNVLNGAGSLTGGNSISSSLTGSGSLSGSGSGSLSGFGSNILSGLGSGSNSLNVFNSGSNSLSGVGSGSLSGTGSSGSSSSSSSSTTTTTVITSGSTGGSSSSSSIGSGLAGGSSLSGGSLSGLIGGSGSGGSQTTTVTTVTTCPKNAAWNGKTCECIQNYYLTNGGCLQCPVNSVWNGISCVCPRGTNLYMGSCVTCPGNGAWDGSKCACPLGFFFVNGSCVKCGSNTFYDGKNCVCNRGYYQSTLGCIQCNPTCGTCSGPAASQCLTCTDVTYTFNNGICTKGTCDPGSFYDSTANLCKRCLPFCNSCVTDKACAICQDGFNPVSGYCTEVCGDGKRFVLPCDDGNNVNGDGCSSTCQIEPSYSCRGGSPTTKDVCLPFAPSKTIISPRGKVHSIGKVTSGYRLNYIPSELLKNGCPFCSQLLLVKQISGDSVATITQSYIPQSQYSMNVVYDFGSGEPIPNFSVTIQVNPALIQYFSGVDIGQVVQDDIDPSLLALDENVETLQSDGIIP